MIMYLPFLNVMHEILNSKVTAEAKILSFSRFARFVLAGAGLLYGKRQSRPRCGHSSPAGKSFPVDPCVWGSYGEVMSVEEGMWVGQC